MKKKTMLRAVPPTEPRKLALTSEEKAEGEKMHALLKRLFPICRSLTGPGVRETLRILKETVPLTVQSVPSGTKCMDWTVPDEWEATDAYILDPHGHKIIDFKQNNLHLVSYSTPFKGRLTLEELQPHLYSIPEKPEAIPYVTSYYKRRWGFCLAHKVRESLKPGSYEVVVDTKLFAGKLNYGELLIPGESEKEILVSANICHPSLANNELSGPVLIASLAQATSRRKPRFSYRFVWVPETIGSLAYLSRHLEEMQRKTVAGIVATCVGDPGPFSYLYSRLGNCLTDRVVTHCLTRAGVPFREHSYLERGSDERQYGAPGIDLPVGSLTRTLYGRFPEYHTSLDSPTFVTAEALAESYAMYLHIFRTIEEARVYRACVLGEPMLSRRGMYPEVGGGQLEYSVQLLMNFLAYCDGCQDLLGIAELLDVAVTELEPIAKRCLEAGLIKELDE